MEVLRAARVIASDRRGSSWPLVIETENGPYLTKLRGAGQGTAALVAEIIVGHLGDSLGLRVPKRALIEVDSDLRSEDRDPELLDLLASSRGTNLGFAWMPDARDFRSDDLARIDIDEASTIVWLDWLVMNPDRTPRNPNIMILDRKVWLIDHGAALPFHHRWDSVTEDSPRQALPAGSGHLLKQRATHVAARDEELAAAVTRDVLRFAVSAVPDSLLLPLLPEWAGPRELVRRREAYVAFLWKRLKAPRAIV